MTFTDREGNTTSYGYDSLRRKIWEKDAAGKTETYKYDHNDNIIEKTDKAGNTIKYTYDKHQNLILTEGPGNKKESYTYDNEGKEIGDVLEADTGGMREVNLQTRQREDGIFWLPSVKYQVKKDVTIEKMKLIGNSEKQKLYKLPLKIISNGKTTKAKWDGTSLQLKKGSEFVVTMFIDDEDAKQTSEYKGNFLLNIEYSCNGKTYYDTSYDARCMIVLEEK